jgi:hypothetical protein
VKQSDLGEYEENAREKQNIQYTGKKHQLPLKSSYTDGKHQCPPCKLANQEESMGLMKMSANCLSMSMYVISMSSFSM